MSTYRVQWTHRLGFARRVTEGPFTWNSIDDRKFWERVEVNQERGCWEWTAGGHELGYGRFHLNGKTQPSHRVSYTWLVGPIPEGYHLDHLCRNPPCVNPGHLEPVTPRENVMRGVKGEVQRAGKCGRGHQVEIGRANCRECDALRAADRRKRLGIVQGRGPRIVPSLSRFAVGGTTDPAVAAALLSEVGVDVSTMSPRATRLRTLRNGQVKEITESQTHRGSYLGVIFE